MSSHKLEYDSSLGGKEVLPTHVQTFRYAASSINEIKGLLDEIQNPTSTKLVFQTLPKHMRRRAMSHHPKRLPRKYRSIHNSQMAKAGKPPQLTKRPSRKYRRKPSNLLKEYIRRQKSQIWLETHIWHAKRFHMISKWGYKLPYASCDKTYRTCYRASAKHCLLQDISFYACVEIQGKFEEIIRQFSVMTNSKCGLGIGAKTFSSGRREGHTELFRAGQYPNGALGKVSFLWRPAESETRILWLFIHPSGYKEILQEIIKAFGLESTKIEKIQIESDNNTHQENGSPGKKKDLQMQFITKTYAYQRAPKYRNQATGICLTELKDTMNRFRLTGPLSQAVLGKALRVKSIRDSEPDNWFQSTMKVKTNSEAHLVQEKFWNNCQGVNSPGELLSNMILGLNVEDPRINRPKKRTKAQPEDIKPNLDVLFDANRSLHLSRFWDFELRNQICSKMMSNHEYCSQREKNSLVPGERCQFEEEMQPVPLLLIQRPGSLDHNYKRLSYACGWDVIIPTGYGMPVWLSLIMWGAKPGGLREFESIQRELGTDQFLPDSVPGIKESAERQLELRMKYFRKPPNKRCNYRKNSICSPFKAPLDQLIREWSPTDKPFFILRDRDLLKNLNSAISQKKPLPVLPPSCLIQINLRMKTRGSPGDFAIICLPTNTDFKRNLKSIKFEKNDPIYTEPIHTDPNETERKKLRQNHKKLLKRMRSRRVREKRRRQEKTEGKITIRPANTSTLVMEQYKKMCELWLPQNNDAGISVRNQCSREVFGYVTRCEFSYVEATVAAIGYVTVAGLEKLMSIWKRAKGSDKMVLVRGTKSRHYRFANFKINCEV